MRISPAHFREPLAALLAAAPTLLREGSSFAVAGVSSAGFDGASGPGTYGAVDHFTRVSDYLGWIRETLASSH